jgi:hypothetical protein
MAILLPTNFSVQTPGHIDTRLVVPLLADRDNIAEAIRYWGMIVHVIDSTGSNDAATYILNKFAVNDDITNNANWILLAEIGAVAAGSTNDIQINNAGALSTDVGFYYDASKDMFVTCAGSLLPDFGTGAHADAGSWSIISGEQHNFKGKLTLSASVILYIRNKAMAYI